MANHSCDTGFVLVGNNTRTCTGDGSSTTGVFDGEAAICERVKLNRILYGGLSSLPLWLAFPIPSNAHKMEMEQL